MGKLYRALKRSLRSMEKTQYEKRTGKIDLKYRFFDLYCAIMDACVYSWLNPITVFRESVVRTARWFPIIWKDRHWDHGFILEILRHKIRFTRECIGKYNRHTTVKQDCHNMRVAELLIERLQKVEYCDKDWEEHYKIYPSRWRCGEDLDVALNRPNEPGEREDVLRISKREAQMKSQDYDYLFKHLKKHLERWWD